MVRYYPAGQESPENQPQKDISFRLADNGRVFQAARIDARLSHKLRAICAVCDTRAVCSDYGNRIRIRQGCLGHCLDRRHCSVRIAGRTAGAPGEKNRHKDMGVAGIPDVRRILVLGVVCDWDDITGHIRIVAGFRRADRAVNGYILFRRGAGARPGKVFRNIQDGEPPAAVYHPDDRRRRYHVVRRDQLCLAADRNYRRFDGIVCTDAGKKVITSSETTLRVKKGPRVCSNTRRPLFYAQAGLINEIDIIGYTC